MTDQTVETPTPDELLVKSLGDAEYPSPLAARGYTCSDLDDRILVASRVARIKRQMAAFGEPTAFESAGPRGELFFDPKDTAVGIVTCGGLCPGLNDVIRSIVLSLNYGYGVTDIHGFRYGYAGLSKAGDPPIELTPERVRNIHEQGGTILGSSRGPQDTDEMIETLIERNVKILFTIGGDGTLKGSQRIADAAIARGLPLSVIAIPKTIDNDLRWTVMSFGFATAVGAAREAISSAHVEAIGAKNGVGLVRLMGRHAGFITAHASLSNPDVNFCLVPEVPFTLDGKGGLLDALETRLAQKSHAVIVVAEGAGQELLEQAGPTGTDASGNVNLGDIGVYLRDRIKAHFAKTTRPVSLKYINPSYMIRSLPANALDSEFCLRLGQHAVHAGMAGRTAMMIGFWHRYFTHVPLPLVTGFRRALEPRGLTWARVLEATGQPASLVGV